MFLFCKPICRPHVLILLSLICPGCSVSQYHIGYHNLGTNTFAGIVSGRTDKQTKQLEDRSIAAIIQSDVQMLHQAFAPKLAAAVGPDKLNIVLTNMKSDYQFLGPYERRRLVDVGFKLDEGNMQDAFKYYDMVGAGFLLRGRPDAIVTLLMTRVNGEIKLCGFEVTGTGPSSGTIRYVYPESVDKAGLSGRSYIIR